MENNNEGFFDFSKLHELDDLLDKTSKEELDLSEVYDLPDEILVNIIMFMEASWTIKDLSVVSKRFYKLCRSDFLWKKFCENNLDMLLNIRRDEDQSGWFELYKKYLHEFVYSFYINVSTSTWGKCRAMKVKRTWKISQVLEQITERSGGLYDLQLYFDGKIMPKEKTLKELNIFRHSSFVAKRFTI